MPAEEIKLESTAPIFNPSAYTGPVIFVQGGHEIHGKDRSWEQLRELGADKEFENPKEIRWIKTSEGGFRDITHKE